MALIDKASLLMVPSTYEPGTLYNVLPSGNRAPDSTDQNSGYDQTRADFDFDRGSNAAATRIDENGVLQKYRENLLLQSNQFDTTWTNTSSTETSGQEGYDGTNNAWKIDITATYGQIIQSVSLSGVNCTSLYVKAGSLGFVRLRLDASPNAIVDFDLSDGSTAYTSGIVAASSESVGGGWYRISMVSNVSSSTFRIYPLIASNDLTGSSGSIYIQSAQLESGLVSTDYLDSTDVTGKAGVLVDMPRINYDANGENGSLLLEPSRQQLLQYSEYISGWTAAGLTITENQTTSPEGVSNAAKLTLPSGSAIKRIALGSMPTTAVARSYSFFVKSDDIAAIQLVHSGDLQGYANFDISSGVVGTKGTKTTSDIESYGNGWYRCIANFDATNAFGSTIYIYVKDNASGGYGGSTSEQGDLFVWGGQYEEGSYVSSYIPNHGSTGGVTRAADSCSVTGASDVFGSSVGTLFFEGTYGNEANEIYLFAQNVLGTATTDSIYLQRSGAASIQAQVWNGSTQEANVIGGSLSVGETFKIAVGFADNDVVLYLNGTQIGTDTSVTIPPLTSLQIGKYPASASDNYKASKPVKQAIVFPTRLTNAELAALTA